MKPLNENFGRILSLLDELKEIQGRTKFQKIVYILKSKDVPFNEKFKFHYYGPFSDDLQLEIEELVDRNIIIETGQKPHIYRLNDKFKDSFDEDENIKSRRKLIEFLNNIDYQKLEVISTMFFIQDRLSDDEEIIKRKTATLKPHLKGLIEESFKIKKEIEKM